VKQGMSRKDALRAVRLERGSIDVSREIIHAARWESFAETCWQDVRFGVRMLRKNPGSPPSSFLRSLSGSAQIRPFSVC